MAYYYSPFRADYRGLDEKKKTGCSLCAAEVIERQVIKTKHGMRVENEYYVWTVNYFPKFEGHTMAIPKKHVLAIGDEGPQEVFAREQMFTLASRALRALYPGAGIEIFLQTGEGSESSVPHLHWHIVPALPGDTLRSFDKLGHFYTVNPDQEKIVVFPIAIKLAREELIAALAPFLE